MMRMKLIIPLILLNFSLLNSQLQATDDDIRTEQISFHRSSETVPEAENVGSKKRKEIYRDDAEETSSNKSRKLTTSAHSKSMEKKELEIKDSAAMRKKERDRLRKAKLRQSYQIARINGTPEEKAKAERYFQQKREKESERVLKIKERIRTNTATENDFHLINSKNKKDLQRYHDSKLTRGNQGEFLEIRRKQSNINYHKNKGKINARSKELYQLKKLKKKQLESSNKKDQDETFQAARILFNLNKDKSF